MLDGVQPVLVKRWICDQDDGLSQEEASRITLLHSCKHGSDLQLQLYIVWVLNAVLP